MMRRDRVRPKRALPVSFLLTGPPTITTPRRAVIEETPEPRGDGDPRAIALTQYPQREALR